ncbi:MAG: hypothetical protein II213_00265, partial [Lachnospiraceae bacterium]|nr:hypothetical protein [Lachnospiraceae bacterium]
IYVGADGAKFTGWLLKSEGYYYYRKGVKVTGWVNEGSTWYYMNPDTAGCEGKMYAAQWTPDGYYVDESGAWDGRPQMLKAQ